MSLLNDAMENCVMIDKITTPDGLGGYNQVWKDGAKFKAAVFSNESIEAKIGEKMGVTSIYTVTTPKNISLEYHDVFRRIRDGKIFRVTSDGDDKYTPEAANLNMRQVSAEEWRLPV